MQQARPRQQAQYDEDYPAKRQRAAPISAPAPQAYPSLALPPLTLPPQQALASTLAALPPALHSTGLQQLGLDRADSGGSCDSQLGLAASGSGGAPGAADPLAALMAAAAPNLWRQPEPAAAPQLSTLLAQLMGQQGLGNAPAPAPPSTLQAAAGPGPAEQQLVSLLSALLEQQQAQQRASAAAAILDTLLQNQGPPLPAPNLQAGQLGSAFLCAPQPAAPAPAPAPPPAPAPAMPRPAAAPAADQSLTALLAQLVGSLAK